MDPENLLILLLVFTLLATTNGGGSNSNNNKSNQERNDYTQSNTNYEGFKLSLDKILLSGIETDVYPGTVALAGTLDNSFSYKGSFGSYKWIRSHDEVDDDIENSKTTIDTKFDLASVSKVVAGTTAVALLYERGYIKLDTLVQDILGPEFAQGGKENITIQNCLLHNAGFAPDPNPLYWDISFGCPNTITQEYPEEDFSCLSLIWPSFLAEEVVTEPGTAFKYSDLSFITLACVVGTVVKDNSLVSVENLLPICLDSDEGSKMQSLLCYYESFVRTAIFEFQPYALSDPKENLMPGTTFIVPDELRDDCMPTINDTVYLHRRHQGQVSDGNTYAMGGISGHAGVFSTVEDMGRLANNLVAAWTVSDQYEGLYLLNSTTIRLFGTQYDPSQSSRGLGWDTNSNDINDYGFSNSCGNLSTNTFMHIGYAGTCICIDPVNEAWTVVLTNRVYTCTGQSCSDPDSSTNTKNVYREFNSVVKNAIDVARAYDVFTPTYEWQTLKPWQTSIPPGLETRLPIGDDRDGKKEARISNPFQLQIKIPNPTGLKWGKNSGKCQYFVRVEMERNDRLEKIIHASIEQCPYLRSDCIDLIDVDNDSILDRSNTVEAIDLFDMNVELRLHEDAPCRKEMFGLGN